MRRRERSPRRQSKDRPAGKGAGQRVSTGADFVLAQQSLNGRREDASQVPAPCSADAPGRNRAIKPGYGATPVLRRSSTT